MLTVRCPKCGSEKICVKLVAYTQTEVWTWEMDGESPLAVDYDSPDADWEFSEARTQFACSDCGMECNADDLVVDPAAPLPSPEAQR